MRLELESGVTFTILKPHETLAVEVTQLPSSNTLLYIMGGRNKDSAHYFASLRLKYIGIVST